MLAVLGRIYPARFCSLRSFSSLVLRLSTLRSCSARSRLQVFVAIGSESSLHDFSNALRSSKSPPANYPNFRSQLCHDPCPAAPTGKQNLIEALAQESPSIYPSTCFTRRFSLSQPPSLVWSPLRTSLPHPLRTLVRSTRPSDNNGAALRHLIVRLSVAMVQAQIAVIL